MTLSISDLTTSATAQQFLAKIQSVATTVGLVPSSWPTNGIANTLYSAISTLLGVPAAAPLDATLAAKGFDGLCSTIAASGFLDLAALVTPDPSVTPGVAPGWLDVLADSRYDLQRTGATSATGPLVITNSTGTTYSFLAGLYHLYDPTTKRGFSNTAPIILAPGDTTITVAADVAGLLNVTASALLPVTSLIGVTVKTAGGANANSLIGVNAQSNASLVAACRAKLQSLGPKLGPGGAYSYFVTAKGLAGYPTLSSVITRVLVTTSVYTGAVTVYVQNVAGTTSGSDATALTTWLQSVCVPEGVTASVVAAPTASLAITCDAYCATANVGSVSSAVATAITNYINGLPIGGTVGPATGVQGAALLAAVFAAVPYLQNIENLQINGGIDVALGANVVAIASPPPVVTAHGTG
ncbi:MAG: hypothetical protein NVS3B10_00040 [Polyangiales bacterium]